MAAHVQWSAPSPFWKRASELTDATRLAMKQPAILRFATDTFMEDFNRTLDVNPSKLPTHEAQYETWRNPAGSAPAVPPPAKSTSMLQQKVARAKANAERRLSMFSSSTGVALADPPSASTSSASNTSAATATAKTLKLYQPAHQRFYLVSSALVCRVPGMPDHTINTSLQEKATFVLRRVRQVTDPTTKAMSRAEYGFVVGPNGGSWQLIASPDTALAPAEERLPLFAVNFDDDGGKKRRVLAGLIPVGRREVYVGAPEQTATPAAPTTPDQDPGAGGATDPGAPPPPVDPRIVLLSNDVIEPWKALVLRAAKTAAQAGDANNIGHADTIAMLHDSTRENIQVGSWYILLDFATFLEQQMNDVWLALKNGTTPSDPAQQAVVTALRNTSRAATPGGGLKTPATLADALVAVEPFRNALESADGAFDHTKPTNAWPDFAFVLADSDVGGGVPNITLPAGSPTLEPQVSLRKISALRNLIELALPKTATAPVPDLPVAALPLLAPDEPVRFVIRCLLERPECTPLDPVILSAATREFELASFFDTDAPARPIRISLPVDTSPGGLRRAPKNTAFMVSDMLCGQINRAKGMGFVDLVLSVLPFPFTKGLDKSSPTPCTTDAGLSLGMICSLSIPIITICALIVLIIMVSLFDLIFRWMPYFFFCFPLPKFSAKSSSAS
ncbi:MAG TPA: hypothetical protein VFA27_01780 [Vicinamibacterales bacterium]|nr:hypothetical protein [Vicinamibacterales bacterium]